MMSGSADPTGIADESLDRYARLVRSTLGVPVALVSLVEQDRQVFPGAQGLPEPWAQRRSTPLSHSFCQHVVSDEAPLVVSDARSEPRLAANLAIPEIGVIAYAGYPITDGAGAVAGSLCAIDTSPRQWTALELAVLEDLAAACSTELAQRALRQAAQEAELRAIAANRSARVLLQLSQRLSRTRTVGDVAHALHRIAVAELGALHGGVWTVEAAEAHFVEDPSAEWRQAARSSHFAVDDRNPIGATIVSGRPLFFRDRASQDARYPGLVDRDDADDGQARAFIPLVAGDQNVGCLVVVWPAPQDFDERGRDTLAALAQYTAQALQRARLLEERVTVARTLQQAMLTRITPAPDLQVAVRYRTAETEEQVGGDWYDVISTPDGTAVLVIGDVVGHDVAASAVMGQLRSLLRAFVWEGGRPPCDLIRRLDQSASDLGVGALATTVVAMLDPGRTSRTLRWSNAGHPAPVMIDPAGRAVSLESGRPDCMIGVAPRSARHDTSVSIAVGSTMLLFTDGLIESRERDLDHGREELLAAAERHHDEDLEAMVDAVLDDMVGSRPGDDIAILAVRLAPATTGRPPHRLNPSARAG